MKEEQRRIIYELDENRDGQTNVQQKYLSRSHDALLCEQQIKIQIQIQIRQRWLCVRAS